MSVVTSPNVLHKQPAEVRTYSMDFTSLLAEEETIELVEEDPVTATPSGLTIDDETVVGSTVAFSVAGGSANISYRIVVRVETSEGNTLEGDGVLRVLDT